jgi:hypothetical protein
MEVLDLKPVKGKQILVFLIGKEDKELVVNERMMMKEVLNETQFKFTTIDPSYDNLKTFRQTPLAEMLNDHNLPCYEVDIPEYAQGYLEAEIAEKKEQIAGLNTEYDNITDKTTFKAQNLKSWIDLVTNEVTEKEDFMALKLRPQWIVKKIVDIVKLAAQTETTVRVLHFTSKKLIPELRKQFEDLLVKTTVMEVLPLVSRNQRQTRTISQEVIS